MVRLWLLLGLVAAIVYVFSIVDCALLERERIRGLPRGVWILVVILFPLVGSALWFLVGRGGRVAPAPARRPARRVVAPDDDPEFLASLGRQAERGPRSGPGGPPADDAGDAGPPHRGTAEGGGAGARKQDGESNDGRGRRDG